MRMRPCQVQTQILKFEEKGQGRQKEPSTAGDFMLCVNVGNRQCVVTASIRFDCLSAAQDKLQTHESNLQTAKSSLYQVRKFCACLCAQSCGCFHSPKIRFWFAENRGVGRAGPVPYQVATGVTRGIPG